MAEVTQGPQDRWNRLNHNWNGGVRDGYAVCSNCGCHENTDEAAEICWKGPAIESLRKAVRKDLERMRAETPAWMKEVAEEVKRRGR